MPGRAPTSRPRQTLTASDEASMGPVTRARSRALIEPGQDELAMPERFGAGEAAVAGADRDVDEPVAGLIQGHLSPENAGDVEIDVLLHLARRLGIGGELDHLLHPGCDHVALPRGEEMGHQARRGPPGPAL